MRTALAALCLLLVATLAVVGGSYLLGYVRVEFGDDSPSRPLPATVAIPAPIADEEAAPVADAPDALPPQIAEPAAPPPVRTVTPSPPPAPSLDPESVASAPRIVGGAGITPGPISREPLQREAVPPSAPEPEPPRWIAFHRVTVIEAGRLDLGKRSVALAGLAPPAPEGRCRPAVGMAEQPCAFLALQAMRQRIRGLGVECELAKEGGAGPAIAPCRIGKTDLGLWLIGQGWAEAGAGAPPSYAEAEKTARCARKGLWLEASLPSDCSGG